MKKTSALIDFQFTIPLLIILCLLFTPIFAYAGTFYRCIDANGSEIISDQPLSAKSCEPIMTFKDMTDEERVNYEKEKDAKEKKRADAYEEKSALNECADRALKKHRSSWDKDCSLYKLPPGCALPIENAKRWDYNLQEERNQCLQAYPQKQHP